MTSWHLDPHPIWRTPCSGPSTWPRARRGDLSRDPRADPDRPPGDPGIRRPHRGDRQRRTSGCSSTPASSRPHRCWRTAGGDRRHRRRGGARAPAAAQRADGGPAPRCCRTRTSSRPSSSRSTTTCTTCTCRGGRSCRHCARPAGPAGCRASTRDAATPTAGRSRYDASTRSCAARRRRLVTVAAARHPRASTPTRASAGSATTTTSSPRASSTRPGCPSSARPTCARGAVGHVLDRARDSSTCPRPDRPAGSSRPRCATTTAGSG